MPNPPSPLATAMPWNLVAAAYTQDLVSTFELYARDALRLAAVPPGARIVDVACGPGTLALLAAQAGHPADAIDFSPQMVATLEARQRELGVTGVTAVVGDGMALPYADATFGGAFVMFGMMFYPDRARGFRELRRVLVPGARSVVGTWQRLESNAVLAAMFGALRQEMGKTLGAPPQQAGPGAQEMPLATEESCRAEMAEAFSDVEVHAITHEQAFSSVGEIWRSIERSMAPIVLMRRGLGEEKWAPLSKAAGDAIAATLGDAPPVMKLPAWLTVGVAR